MTISIISACKNRGRALSVSISSWIQFDEVTEIIIVDWNSDESINYLTKLDKRIKIITVKDEKYFNQPQPLNLASTISSGEYLLKLDCDHILNPYFNFFEYHKPKENEFIVGCNSLVKDELLHPLWGLLYLKKSHFEAVGGYNENMGKYYAVEDDELTMRLISFGLVSKKIEIEKLTLIHTPHPDKNRIENFESFSDIERKLNNKLSKNVYSEATKLSKLKNYERYPFCSKMIDLVVLDSDNPNPTIIEPYLPRLYNWKVESISNQIYEAVKI
jgi:glycosyltransferase involved in cell wall biosynthesis